MHRAAAVLLCLIVISTPALAEEPQVNGTLTMVDGQRVLRVWGTPAEMGFAHGYLLGEEVHALFRGYVLSFIAPFLYEVAADLLPRYFTVEPEFAAEAEAILAGMQAAGVNLYIPELGRVMGPWDLYVANALADIRGMACSSIAVWGERTLADPAAQGQTIHARDLDWTLAGDDKYLLSRSTVVMIFEPSDETKQRVASVSFPGFIGCLSCMNESGVVATLNMAHNGGQLVGIDDTEPFRHINFTMRDGLSRDVDGDGASTIHDVIEAVREKPRSGGYIIHATQPVDDRVSVPSRVIEVNNLGFAERSPAHTPECGDDALFVTNHFTVLREELPCERFDTMKKRVLGQNGFTGSDLWSLEHDVMQDWLFSTTVQTMIFYPESRRMGVAFTDASARAPEKQPAFLTGDALFPESGDDAPDDEDAPAAAGDDDDNGCG